MPPTQLSDQEEVTDEDVHEESTDDEWVSGADDGARSRIWLTVRTPLERRQGDSNLPGNIHRRRRQLYAPPHTRLGAFLRKLKRGTKTVLSTLNDFMTVPMYASLISIFIAMIPPLQSTLAKTRPLTEAIKSAGQCSSESWRGRIGRTGGV
jgi:hypothetical protein